jgi:hypothetical protein
MMEELNLDEFAVVIWLFAKIIACIWWKEHYCDSMVAGDELLCAEPRGLQT